MISDVKTRFCSLSDLVTDFYSNVAKKKAYWIPVVFLTVLSYGFSMLNRTISIDDLARQYYVGSGNAMISGMRWGMTLYARLLTMADYVPFIDKFLACLFFVFGAILLSALLYSLNGKNKNPWIYAAFSGVLITFPLLNEIWEYNGANMIVPANMNLVALALLYQLSGERKNIQTVLIAGLILTPVMASYEAGVFVYITLVFFVLLMQFGTKNGHDVKIISWLREGISYALPLVVALAMRIIVGVGLIKLYQVNFQNNGRTGIAWTSGDLSGTLQKLWNGTVQNYWKMIPRYFPLRIFAMFVILFLLYVVFLAVKNRNVSALLIGAFTLLSLFALELLQGTVMVYRTAHTFQVFAAFTAYLLMTAPWSRKGLQKILIAVMLIVGYRQAVYMNWILALNNQRSDNEAAIMQQIGFRIYSEFDRKKPTVFVGKLDMGDDIENKLQKERAESNLNSMIISAAEVFDCQYQMKEYMAYYGYDIEVLFETGPMDLTPYEQAARDAGMHPLEIRDMGEYLLIYLGEYR